MTETLRYRPPARSAPPMPPQGAVTTFLTPLERQRVDAAGQGCYVAIHRESLDELIGDLRSGTVNAVLVSVSRYQTQHAHQMARLVKEFPRIPAVALLTATESRTTQALLALGQQGVRALVDVRDPQGWRDLRQFVSSDRSDLIERDAIARIRDDLTGATIDCLRFFDALFLLPPTMSTVQQFARTNGIVPSTFMSRFFREKLPAPKRYIAMARLVRAARLFENPGLSITHVANHLEYSSAQSFSRHMHLLMQCTPMQFRRKFTGQTMLTAFREQLVLPFRDTLLRFEPFAVMPPWSVLRDAPPSSRSHPQLRPHPQLRSRKIEAPTLPKQ